MADLLGQAAAWLEEQRTLYAARDVVYTRGAYNVTLKSTPGRSQFDVDDGNGILTRLETHDEILNVADLILNGAAIEPKAGDKIVVGGRTYLVHDVGNEPCWRFTDQYLNAYRIHTKHLP